MSVQVVIDYSTKIERLLGELAQTGGRATLGEKLSAAEDKLPDEILKAAHYVRRLRNQVVHENAKLSAERLRKYVAAAESVIEFIEKQRRPASSPVASAGSSELDWPFPVDSRPPLTMPKGVAAAVGLAITTLIAIFG